MHPVIDVALTSLPEGTDLPRTWSFNVPESFKVDRDTLRFNVHIRTKTVGYLAGWSSNALKERWEADCQELMGEIGFVKDKAWFYPSGGSRTEHLYAHPDDISGIITLPQVLALHAAIERGGYGIVNRNIDVYEVFEDLSEEELVRRLDYYKNAIRGQLVDAHQTTRKTKFKAVNAVKLATDLPGLSLLGEKAWEGYGADSMMSVLRDYVIGVQAQLVRERWLFTYEKDGTTFYRSANKTEQREMKLSLAA